MLNKTYIKDALERLLWTAAQVLGGVITAAQTDVAPGSEDQQTFLWTVLFALAKVALAKLVGDRDTAAIGSGQTGGASGVWDDVKDGLADWERELLAESEARHEAEAKVDKPATSADTADGETGSVA